MRDYKKLRVWSEAHNLALATYRATRAFPSEERFGLQSQMRRAAVSVPANIAEGSGRGSSADFNRFLRIAFGSASELAYLVTLAFDLRLLGRQTHQDLATECDDVMKMLRGLSKSVLAEIE